MSSDFNRATDFDSDHQQHSAQNEMAGPVAEAAALPSAVLTAQGRGNAVQRQIAIQRMQQTHGNRAVQRAIALQRSAAEAEAGPQEDIGARIQSRAGSGSSLEPGLQRQMEGHLGTDLSGVRVHNDAEADHMTRSVDALAFTSGSDVYVRSDAPRPGSAEGDSLYAHEITHVKQQSEGAVSGTAQAGGVAVSDPSDSFEQAAHQSAASFMANRSSASADASVQTMRAGSMPAVQREAAPEEEPVQTMPALQTMRAGSMPAVQREAAPEEGEPVQTMRVGSMPAVQREAAPEEEEPVQTMRVGAMPAVQREAAPEEEEPVQTMRVGAMPAVQREAAPEEDEPVQTMRVGAMPAVQRCDAEEEQA